MLKYLRIAVTALSLTACVLLIALWVRSYWGLGVTEVLHFGTKSRPKAIAFSLQPGILVLAILDFARALHSKSVYIDLWIPTLATGVLAAAPWLPWSKQSLPWSKRFSLRTSAPHHDAGCGGGTG